MICPARVQLSRRKGWRMPPNTVSVARPTRWGNPYKIAPAIESQGVTNPEITPESAVLLFRIRWIAALKTWPRVREELEHLRGKNLACWCALGQPCHADVLLELANQ